MALERRPLHTTLLIIAAGGAAWARSSGGKLFQMEGKRQRAYRQEQAKAAAGKFVDEVAFEMNKDTRDGLRRTQRRLRDEFQSAGRQHPGVDRRGARGRPAGSRPAAGRPGGAGRRSSTTETRQLGRIRRDHARRSPPWAAPDG